MRRVGTLVAPIFALGVAICGALLICGCGSPEPNEELGSGKLRVVAAENVWGSIAQQLGGDRAHVRSIVVNPNTDPHSYEPTAADARAMAGAQLAIVNGIGYDEWAKRLLAAGPSDGRLTLNVGDALGLTTGEDNPHQWYSPAGVHAAIAAIAADYEKLRPADTAYFSQRREAFEHKGLARYNALVAQIGRRYQGVPVGYSESIFQPLGEALGLRLLTPSSFAKAVAEGSEVSAQDKQAVDRQATNREIKVWVYNSQNATPDVGRVNELALASHIPVVTVTETLAPASDTFEQWQVAQLERLRAALHQATGR
ncbi:MAG TPA: zinc ABC transporter substrate-binding protein [Solirubrobacteraceae bacterium]|jgi:zinc/manganese transport system substrate-binding protein